MVAFIGIKRSLNASFISHLCDGDVLFLKFFDIVIQSRFMEGFWRFVQNKQSDCVQVLSIVDEDLSETERNCFVDFLRWFVPQWNVEIIIDIFVWWNY